MSVPTNIAEGAKRRTNADFARFLNHSEASLSEVQYLLMLARDLGYVPRDEAALLLEQTERTSQMLYSLRSRVERDARA